MTKARYDKVDLFSPTTPYKVETMNENAKNKSETLKAPMQAVVHQLNVAVGDVVAARLEGERRDREHERNGERHGKGGTGSEVIHPVVSENRCFQVRSLPAGQRYLASIGGQGHPASPGEPRSHARDRGTLAVERD